MIEINWWVWAGLWLVAWLWQNVTFFPVRH